MTIKVQALSEPQVPPRSKLGWSLVLSGARQIILPVATASLVIVMWEVIVDALAISPVILPPPSAIFLRMIAQLGVLWDNAIPTAVQSLVSFALSVVFGGLLGILLVYVKPAREALYPNVVLFQLIPKVAVAPLFMLWFGIGWEARVSIAVFVAFFPIVISTAAGLNSVDPILLRLCQSLTATPLQVFFKVRLPSSLPHIFSGMKISMTLAIIGVIVGEFITSQNGLGYIILFAGSRLDTSLVMAAILVLCIVGLVLYGLIVVAEWLILKRYGS